MKKFMGIMKDEKGQGMVEYIVALGGVVVIAIAIMTSLNSGTSTSADTVTGKVNNAVSGTYGE